jgi:hypothetical protein
MTSSAPYPPPTPRRAAVEPLEPEQAHEPDASVSEAGAHHRAAHGLQEETGHDVIAGDNGHRSRDEAEGWKPAGDGFVGPAYLHLGDNKDRGQGFFWPREGGGSAQGPASGSGQGSNRRPTMVSRMVEVSSSSPSSRIPRVGLKDPQLEGLPSFEVVYRCRSRVGLDHSHAAFRRIPQQQIPTC